MTLTLMFVFILCLSMKEDYTTQLVTQTYNLITVSHRIFGDYSGWSPNSQERRSPIRQFCIYLTELHLSGEFGALKK